MILSYIYYIYNSIRRGGGAIISPILCLSYQGLNITYILSVHITYGPSSVGLSIWQNIFSLIFFTYLLATSLFNALFLRRCVVFRLLQLICKYLVYKHNKIIVRCICPSVRGFVTFNLWIHGLVISMIVTFNVNIYGLCRCIGYIHIF